MYNRSYVVIVNESFCFLKDDVPGMLSYSLTVCMSLLQSRQFRNKVSFGSTDWLFRAFFSSSFISFFGAGVQGPLHQFVYVYLAIFTLNVNDGNKWSLSGHFLDSHS